METRLDKTDMMRNLTKDEAIKLGESEWWEDVTLEEAAFLQLQQDKLCMPFEKFHEGVERLLARPVWSHEFAMPDALIAEAKRRKESQ